MWISINFPIVVEYGLKHTTQPAQNSFSRKSNLKHCIIFNVISFSNDQGLLKIRLAYSKVLLLINYFDHILWNTFEKAFWWSYKRRQIFLLFIKGDKYLFLIKVGAANVSMKLNYFQSRVGTIQKDPIYHTVDTRYGKIVWKHGPSE